MLWKCFDHCKGAGDFETHLAKTAKPVQNPLLSLPTLCLRWKEPFHVLQRKFAIVSFSQCSILMGTSYV
jgi:hypothetical protein